MREYDAKNGTSFFTSYYADVEYNRMGNGDLKYYEDSLKRPKYMVSDLLIQSRGYEGNLLAVELKKKGATKEAIDNDIKRLKSLVTPGALSKLTGCVHDTLLGAIIIYSKDGVDMDIFEFSSNEGKVIPRKYSLRCLFRDYDETKVKAMDICDGTQCRLIDLDEPFVPKWNDKDRENQKWHMLMPSELTKALSTSLNFYLDMANKGIKVPSAKQLRMMSALGQFFGGKEL